MKGVLEGASEDRQDLERHTRRAQLLSPPRWLLSSSRSRGRLGGHRAAAPRVAGGAVVRTPLVA